jgi:oligopeptide transport system permease protein
LETEDSGGGVNMTQLNKEMIQSVSANELNGDILVRENISYWQDAWRRLKKNPIAMAALFVLIILTFLVIIGPKLRGLDYITINANDRNLESSSKYWFGTDALGRDMFSRVWVGARISIMVAIIATVVEVILGCIYGGIMAYFGGMIDEIMMRIIEVLNSIPSLIVTILIMVVLGNGIIPLLFALCLTSWTGTARMIRGQIMQIRESEYVLAAQALGASNTRVISKHLLPNTIGLLILNVSSSIPAVIFSETILSFLGIGLQPPYFSLGTLISLGQQTMAFYPYQLLFPAGILCLIVLAFNLLGDGLRDALDPKLRR